MHLIGSFSIVVITIVALVSSNPLEQNSSIINQARHDGETVLTRYFYLIHSDKDHLVHALFRLLMNNPNAFVNIPYRALDIALKNVEHKLGRTNLDLLTKPFLLAMEENYQRKIEKQIPPVKITDEIKDKIEDALDEFLEQDALNTRL